MQLHNSNKKKRQLKLDGTVKKEKWHFVGIYTLAELKSCNKIKNDKAWTFEIENIPTRKPTTLNKYDEKINKALSSANRGQTKMKK